MVTGIILFAHGSRDPHWRLPIEAVAVQITQRQPGTLVRCAYLELCLPTLPDATIDLIASGARKIKVFPLFLGVGKHAREDLPLLINDIRTAHPDLIVELLQTAGESSRLISLMAEIALS
jgi:sirohydrochlorin cobaltochelatase